MTDVKAIWRNFKDKYKDNVGIGCKDCNYFEKDPMAHEEYRCGHKRFIFFLTVRNGPKRTERWEIIRERPPNNKEIGGKCPKKRCTDGSKKCHLAHSEAELDLWKILKAQNLFVSEFPDKLLYDDGEVQTTNVVANVVRRRPRPRRHSHTDHGNRSNNVTRNYIAKTMDFLSKTCEGGRFLFACEDCYKLEPHIIKEMEIGYGKVQKLICSWCRKSKELLLYEREEKYENGFNFYEYEVIRKRMSTTMGNSLCRRYPNCDNGKICTFAHGYQELKIWKWDFKELGGRAELVKFCNSEAAPARSTLDGVIYCDVCCIGFSSKADYFKNMGADHTHFPGIRRKTKTWRFRRFPNETFHRCSFEEQTCPQRGCCPNAHSDEELQEWQERLALVKGREKFKLASDYIPKLQQRIRERRLKSILEEKGLNVYIDQKERTISLDTKTTKWKMKIDVNDTEKVLKHISFPLSQGYKLRHVDQETWTNHIELKEQHRKKMEFWIIFQNHDPPSYGRQNGELVFELEKDQLLLNLRLSVLVRGTDVNVNDLNTEMWVADWVGERNIIEYQPKPFNHEKEYEERMTELKNKYILPKVIEEAEPTVITAQNYVGQIHALLYREEKARREVLSKLNIECGIEIMSKLQEGNCLARLEVPVNGSSDEGVLFRDSCSTICVGEKDDFYAYEAIIRDWQDNRVLIFLSSRCMEDLKLVPHQTTVLQVQFQLDRETFCLRHYAVDGIREKVSLVCPARGAYASLNYRVAEKKCTALDNMQNEVYKFLHFEKERNQTHKSYPPLIVAGPFGTGKTHTIKNILVDLLENGDSNTTILLCTLSNSAADMYLEDGTFEKFGQNKVLRVMYHGRNHMTVKEEVKKYCLIDNQFRFRYPKLEELRKYKLIVTTFLTAYTLVADTGAFTHIFLDEASQAMEADVIMALTLAGAEDSRILIAGDHKQLTERMYSDNGSQIKTLLERMYEAYDFDKRCRALLTNNYRCVDGILQLITKLFYKENILNCAGNAKCIPGAKPFYFIHIQGDCVPTSNGEFVNKVEADQILLEVRELVLRRQLAEQEEVVVVSAFLTQVKLIRKILRKEGLDRIEVQTVRNIQGQQFKIVILCTVMQRITCLKNVGGNFGFVSDPRLLNTALTRAQSLIIAVGDAVTLCSTEPCHRYWKGFLKLCEEEQTVLPPTVNIDSIKRDIKIATMTLDTNAPVFIPGSATTEKPVTETTTDIQHEDTAENPSSSSENFTQDTSFDEDEADMWFSYDSVEDKILDDMLKLRMGIDTDKVRVDVRKGGEEFIRYGNEDDVYDDDNDPNEVFNRHKPRKTPRHEAIFPKYTVDQLEQLLRRDGDNYKRCRIKIHNWCTAEATQTEELTSNRNNIGKTLRNSESNGESDISDIISEVTDSDDDKYSLASDTGKEKPPEALIIPALASSTIHIESKPNLGRTFDKDEVLVQILKNNTKSPQPGIQKCFGKVIGVLKRHRNPRLRHFLCLPDELNSALMCPIDKKLTKIAILIPKNHNQSAKSRIHMYRFSGQKDKLDLKYIRNEEVKDNKVYVVRYLQWSEYCIYPLGFVEKSFLLSDFKQYLKLEFGVPGEYRPNLKAKAKNIRVPKCTKDPIRVFTIDPEGSMDLDDAISFETCKYHKDCFKIGIHITDVACVLEEGSDIDKEAQRRLTTFYGSKKDSPVHMLPQELSTKTLSILPDQTRPAISTFFHSSEKSPHEKDFATKDPERTFVKSYRRLTYREAEDLIRNDKNSLDVDDTILSETLRKLWKIMWDWRVSRLDGASVYKDSDEYGDIVDECRAHLLVEEAMISVNANTAAYLVEKEFEFPVRVQDMPDEQEGRNWVGMHKNLFQNSSYALSCSKYLKRLRRVEEGANESEDVSEDEGDWEQVPSRRRKRKLEDIPSGGSIYPINEIRIFSKYWKDLVECYKRNDLETFSFIAALDDFHPSLVSTVERFRRIQKKSDFVTSTKPHFSLRLKLYTQSSSPIRRYVDIIIQRCIHNALENKLNTDSTQNVIERFCWQHEDRAKEYDKKLYMTEMAESLKHQPFVVEACVTEINDAFLSIAVPLLRKYLHYRAKELHYENLIVVADTSGNSDEEKAESEIPRTSRGEVILDKVLLIWELRYYDIENDGMTQDKGQRVRDSSAMKIPAKLWQTFVRVIFEQPRIRDSDYTKTRYDNNLGEAVQSIIDGAVPETIKADDAMSESTRNNPKPIYHIRKINWNMTPGTPLTLQVSSSSRKRQLPEPVVQLVSIAPNLDVCIEHTGHPVDVFARDAIKIIEDKKIDKDLSSYQKKWEPLVRMDAANSAVKERCSITLEGVKIRWNKKRQVAAEGDDGFGSEQHSQVQKTNSFKLNYRFCDERYIDIYHGYLLCLRLKGVPNISDKEHVLPALYEQASHSSHTAVLHAVVTSVHKPSKDDSKAKKPIKVHFRVLQDYLNEESRVFIEDPEAKWTVEVIPLSNVHRHMIESLNIIDQSPEIVQRICMGSVRPSPIQFEPELEEIASRRVLNGFPHPLNMEQYREEQKAIKMDFSLIQGPPGTGKSFLGAQLATKFVYLNKMKASISKTTQSKVLYCGPSNKAVDVAAGFLKDINGLKVVRMYSTALSDKVYSNPLKPPGGEDDDKTPDDKLKGLALHELIRDPDVVGPVLSDKIKKFDSRVNRSEEIFTRAELSQHNAVVTEAKKLVLNICDIIICTCAASCRLAEYDLNVEQCIIDECAMCSEPETILPLTNTRPNQVVLIGDHKQLRPVITCSEAEKLGLANSLFSRYSEFAGMLTNQYRMHPEIMEFPSREFYEGKLTCDESVRRRGGDGRNPFPGNRGRPAIFWNVRGEEKVQHFKSAEGGNKSKYNITEVMAVIKVLQRLYSSGKSLSRIMVLSPYTAQCARIRERIKKSHSQLRDVHVGTVVTSQGSEADYIILSTVRSLPDSMIVRQPNIQWRRKHLGFLIDPNQVNVALTRAKRKLIIIGNKELLSVDGLWNRLISSYERRNAVFDNLFET